MQTILSIWQKKLMIKLFFLTILLSLICSCNEKLDYSEKVDLITISGYVSTKTNAYRTIDIKNREYINKIWSKTKNLNYQVGTQLKPYISSIDIDFSYYVNGDEILLKKYYTSVIIKENNESIIATSDGNFVDDEYSKFIINLLHNPPKEVEVYNTIIDD